jgi:hypothetical protein
MSLPGKPNGAESGLDAEVAALAALLSQGHVDESELSEQHLAELLRQLEQADGVARGVEDRLDGMLKNLDDLLEGMESGSQDGKQEGSSADGRTLPVHEEAKQSKG